MKGLTQLMNMSRKGFFCSANLCGLCDLCVQIFFLRELRVLRGEIKKKASHDQ